MSRLPASCAIRFSSRQEINAADRIIVAAFDNPNAAYDAASSIKNLKNAGIADFKLKAGVMVSRTTKET